MSFALFRPPVTIKTESQPLVYKDVLIKPNPRAKRMTLRLDYKGRCFVASVPKRFSMRAVQAFITKNEAWMDRKLKQLQTPIPYADGSFISLCGDDVRICVTHNDTIKRSFVKISKDSLIVQTPLEDPAPRIERYIKTRAKNVFTELAHEKAEQSGVKINRVSVRDTTSRWGSCSANGNISLSWRLIHAPYIAMDYVIAHEVAHLTHMNHGKAFWTLCMELADNGEDGHAWMRTHGQSLMRFGA